ncbi:MAG: menaquinone-specific isochorismate synthase [Solirubrobacterales bacterium]|nr:menaquinone-specific isochorismate synthase [Solirubrobacterales bacterium]
MITTQELLPQLERAAAGVNASKGLALASATVEIDPVDPAALVFASRRAADRWFCWEQPDRDGLAIAALGSVRELVSRGEDRFADLGERWRRLLGRAAIEAPDGAPPGAGPLLTGGFAFAPDGGAEAQWSSLPPALLVLPEVSLFRSGGRCFLTVNALFAGEVERDSVLAAAGARLGSLRESELEIEPADPHPTGEVRIDAPHSPGHYEELVADGVGRISAGEFEKVVLAREIRVQSHAAHDPAALFAALRELFPSCFCFCCGTPEAAFLGASPELLVRRNGAGAATVALAGTTGRSADPAVDDHLGERLLHSDKNRSEHRIVVERIERGLGRLSVWVQSAPEPGLIKVANVQHLATPIRAQLADSQGAVELAGLLHPTPAVGGEPSEAAVEAISELEGMDRGWYAGPVGWVDGAEDGEFCVALRSGLIRDRTAHLYAGAGIVADSDPAAELAETELKLGAMLPLVTA